MINVGKVRKMKREEQAKEEVANEERRGTEKIKEIEEEEENEQQAGVGNFSLPRAERNRCQRISRLAHSLYHKVLANTEMRELKRRL